MVVIAALVPVGCGGDGAQPGTDDPVIEDSGPIHVHGLGINPADQALFIATHTGLFRAPRNERKAERVAGRYQDTMAFTVVGPNRFMGSGHPDGRDDLPPFLGLIETRDAGESWQAISLQGKADFHVLEVAGRRVYGFGSDFQTRRAAVHGQHRPPRCGRKLADAARAFRSARVRQVLAGPRVSTARAASTSGSKRCEPARGPPARAVCTSLGLAETASTCWRRPAACP